MKFVLGVALGILGGGFIGYFINIDVENSMREDYEESLSDLITETSEIIATPTLKPLE